MHNKPSLKNPLAHSPANRTYTANSLEAHGKPSAQRWSQNLLQGTPLLFVDGQGTGEGTEQRVLPGWEPEPMPHLGPQICTLDHEGGCGRRQARVQASPRWLRWAGARPQATWLVP